MVVGSGLIASAFSSYKEEENIIVMASGVSNSRETNYMEFKREIDLISQYIGTKSKFIYFSSISIFDKSIDTLYVNHKKYIEKLISNNFESYLILRLPIVLGISNNPNTFLNNIRRKIISGDTVFINNKSSIYMIDIDDIKNLIPNIIKTNNNKDINVCFDNKISVFDTISIIERLLNISSKKEIINKGFDFTIDPLFKSKVDNTKLLKKYINGING
jgi:dTDP-4-dehydrorhamnose reductase